MITPQQRDHLIRQAEALPKDLNRNQFGERILTLLTEALSHYNWIGIYWLHENELLLGPYIGAPTPHTVIPVGIGVCGMAIATGRNQLIHDVGDVENYLACSLDTQSELVTLLRETNGDVVGQIDVDGHTIGAFDKSDEEFLMAIGDLLMKRST